MIEAAGLRQSVTSKKRKAQSPRPRFSASTGLGPNEPVNSPRTKSPSGTRQMSNKPALKTPRGIIVPPWA